METVPLAFCDSVCASLDRLYLTDLNEVCSKGWHTSATEYAKNSVKLILYVDQLSHAMWTYDIVMVSKSIDLLPRSISFSEMKQLDKRYVQVRGMFLGNSPFAPKSCTVAEIFQIATCTFPFFVRDSHFKIYRNCGLPEHVLSWLLSQHKNTPYSSLVLSQYQANIEDFLMAQLQSDRLRKIELSGAGWSSHVQSSLEEFALSRPFRSLFIDCSSMIFGRAFLEQFLEKPADTPFSDMEARFSVTFEELKDYAKDLQVEVFDEKDILWRRDDGVRVKVRETSSCVYMVRLVDVGYRAARETEL